MRRGALVASMLAVGFPVLLPAILFAAVEATGPPPSDWYSILRDVGFPAFVALYVLYMMNGTIAENTSATRELKSAVERVVQELRRP